MKYWLLAGLKESRLSENLRRSLNTLSSCGLSTETIVISTGVSFEGALNEPQSGVGPFLRRAFQELRRKAQPGDWFVRVDSDDYYGPQYLAQVDAARSQGALATGIVSPFIRTEQGRLYHCQSRRSESSAGGFGGTLAGEIQACPDFRPTPEPWGEDVQWVADVLKNGLSYVKRPSTDYAWCRWHEVGHTFPISGESLLHMIPWDARDIGGFSPEKVSKIPEGEPVPFDIQKAREGFNAMLQSGFEQYGRAV